MNNGAPFYYDYVNTTVSQFTPNVLHTNDNLTSRYFENYLFQRVLSVFDFELPEYWDKDYFLYVLFTYGYIGIIPGGRFGKWVPQACTLKGYDLYYRPTNIIVANPYAMELNNEGDQNRYKIGDNAELIKVQPNWHSVYDIVSLYSDMLAESLTGMAFNLVNSKLAYIFATNKKSIAESFKKMYDQIQSGRPAVVVDKALFDEKTGELSVQMFQSKDDVYNMTDRLADFRKILNMFDTEIGIPSVNYEKKERMLVDEVNANNVETESLSDLWLETIREGVERTNALTGLDIKVSKRYGEDFNIYDPTASEEAEDDLEKEGVEYVD